MLRYFTTYIYIDKNVGCVLQTDGAAAADGGRRAGQQ